MPSEEKHASCEKNEDRGYAVAEHRHRSWHHNDDDWHNRREDGYGRQREKDLRGGQSRRSGRYESSDTPHYKARSDECHGEGIQCVECATWNYPEDVECYRCGRPLKEMRGDGISEAVDEFGRVAKKKSKKQPKWPPCFEENGSKYVFDGRSGMFYETSSDFFYDPNSKLYYGNKQQTYYRFNDGAKKYDVVEKTEPSTTADAAEPIVESKSRANGAKITIKLKTKSIGKPRKTPNLDPKKPPPALEPKVSKKHALDINKWSERQAEKRDEGEHQKKVPKTAKGEPICLLCRRKFPTLAKLEYHEKASKLHEENLVQSKRSHPQYVDRAQLRRDVQGPSCSLLEPATKTCLDSSPELSRQPALTQDTLGDHNIGNKMLRKLGWKPDERRNAMDKDWERIEAMASQGCNTTGQSGVGR